MNDLENELSETKVQIKNLGLFSVGNALELQHILERYDGIIEQLYYHDQIIYLQSTLNIAIIEPEMIKIFLATTKLKAKRSNYAKAKLQIMLSVNEDIYNYQLFLNRKRLTIPNKKSH